MEFAADHGISQLSAEDQALLAKYPRDFKAIPTNTDYGEGEVAVLNKADEAARMDYLEASATALLKNMCAIKERPVFTIAMIAGDLVMLDMIAKAGLLDKIAIIYIDTYTLFPETHAFLRQVEAYYGFKAHIFHAEGINSQAEYDEIKGPQFCNDPDYDRICKVEPFIRSLTTFDTDCCINGRRRDHGAERKSIAVWEAKKLNPLAHWTFEDCWNYLRRHNVPYHPLHDAGYSSIGDMHSTDPVPLEKWMEYNGERSGRFQNLVNKDGTKKTECGIHSEKGVGARQSKKRRNESTSDLTSAPVAEAK